jgi:protein tyrosine/serine phosphatase
MQKSNGTRGRMKFRNIHARLDVFLFILLAGAAWARAQSSSAGKVDIDNFGQINQDYFRGSQPDSAGFAKLKQLGIKSVIDLQADGDSREPAWVRVVGMQYFNIPLSSRRSATEEQTEYFLKLVNDPENLPVYVHCAGGRHRTGEMTAIFRITHDGWTADHAYQEMKNYDFYSIGGHGSLKDYVFQYYREQQTSKEKTAASESNPALIRK